MWKTLGKVKRWVLGCAGETSWRVGSAIDLWNKRKFFHQNQIYIVSFSLSLSHPQVHSDIHFVYNFLAASLGKQWPPVKLQNRPTTEKISIFTASCHHKMHTEIALQWKVFRPSRNRFVCTLGVAQLRRRRITLKIKTTAKLFFRFVCCAIKLHMHLSIVTQLGACKKKLHRSCIVFVIVMIIVSLDGWRQQQKAQTQFSFHSVASKALLALAVCLAGCD